MDIPDRLDVVSMRTHRLLLAVALDGVVQLDSRLAQEDTARVLRSIADALTGRPGECVYDLFTGTPGQGHHAPPATPCACSHNRTEHFTVNGRLQCDAQDGAAPCTCREYTPVGLVPAAGQQGPAVDPNAALVAHVTEYRVPVPEAGGVVLLVRRQSPTSGVGWAVSTIAHGGGRAWTTEGWQEVVSALSVGRLFCWPTAETAVTGARRALAAQSIKEDNR
ncbi:hypothetical protein ACFVU3_07990 [Streptomyces sp. NPDC058052]|uniref:hypothetical protein n=1 Tax=Streptomyces sp. NPDC058052 TaxID=3346316 RepID=UPI0036E5864F